AALHGRTSVQPDDLVQVAMLVLPHRRRARPFEQPGLDEGELQRVMRRGAAVRDGAGGDDDGADGDGGDDGDGGCGKPSAGGARAGGRYGSREGGDGSGANG